ncbi:hypothetical protein FRC12_005731 [Ceratobasidium sp. 428]|nr:hypothetical protein FRC12_005731 [Ceratobasidium sp. 428]
MSRSRAWASRCLPALPRLLYHRVFPTLCHMPPRRPVYTQADIDAQLQAIHLLDPSSTTENLEGLGTLVKSVHDNRQQEAFLRTVKGLIESKDADIEKICADNYQDFASSVSTLLTVRTYTVNLRDKINILDQSVAQVGQGLASKKRALLKSKRTAANLDEAIGTLQSCLRVLDMVNKVGDMIKARKYWSALRTLDEIRSLPFSSLSQTPFLDHILASLPSLRGQIKDAVTAEHKSWLFAIRELTGQVGELALAAVQERTKRWKVRREKEALAYANRVGCAVELVTNEKIEYDVLNNDRIKVDFKPLYQSIHIHTALDALDEFQRTYQADRAVGKCLTPGLHSSSFIPFIAPAPGSIIPNLNREPYDGCEPRPFAPTTHWLFHNRMARLAHDAIPDPT